MSFSGRSVLVTGAGKGIGRAIATMLAERGAEVVALSRSAEDLESLAGEIGCRTIVADLTDAEAARSSVRAAMPVDLLVNNAGITILAPFVETRIEDFDLVHAVNTRAPLIASQEYARDRIARGLGGAIVNVSSNASWLGLADHTSYCASKGALDAISRVMANELGRQGIRVNCVNPAVTLTADGPNGVERPGQGRAGPQPDSDRPFPQSRGGVRGGAVSSERCGVCAERGVPAGRWRVRRRLIAWFGGATESRGTSGHSSLVIG